MKIRGEIKNLDMSLKKVRESGLLVGGVFLVLGAFLAWRGRPHAPVFFACGGFLVLFGLARPMVLRPLYRLWMVLAILMGWVMSRVLLSMLFYIALAPIGLWLRLSGKDLLDLQFKDGQNSYWKLRADGGGKKEDCEKQY